MSHNWQVCKVSLFSFAQRRRPVSFSHLSSLTAPQIICNSSHCLPGALLRCVVLCETYDNASWLDSSHSNYGTSVTVMGSTSVHKGSKPSTTWAFPSCVSVCFQRTGRIKWPEVDNNSVVLQNLIKMCFKTVLVENVQPG